MTSFFKRVFKRNKKEYENTPPTLVEAPSVETIPEETIRKIHLDTAQLVIGVAQSVGIQRDQNEDALFTLATTLATGEKQLQFGLFAVADGMGGHQNGEIASSLAIGKFTTHVIGSLYLPLFSSVDQKMDISLQEIMQVGILQAHQVIRREAIGSGTTLSAALILEDQMTIAHVGDSRIYLIHPDGTMQLLTHDHSLVKRLEEIGQLTPEQASTYPHRNVLYRALGQGEPFEPDIATYHLEKGCQIVICSDGLWGSVSENDILDAIRSPIETQLVCQSLVDLANSAGGSDNISVILIRIPE